MLDLMRKHARNWIMKVLLGIIIVVFIFYFGSIGRSRQADIVATVDGKTIAYVDLQKEYQNLSQFYRQRLGGMLTDEMLKGLNLKQQALDNLIQQAIILQKAKELDVKVTDEEVQASILATAGAFVPMRAAISAWVSPARLSSCRSFSPRSTKLKYAPHLRFIFLAMIFSASSTL